MKATGDNGGRGTPPECRQWEAYGTCSFGNRCKYTHNRRRSSTNNNLRDRSRSRSRDKSPQRGRDRSSMGRDLPFPFPSLFSLWWSVLGGQSDGGRQYFKCVNPGSNSLSSPSTLHLCPPDSTAYFPKKRLYRTNHSIDEWSSPQIRLKALTPAELRPVSTRRRKGGPLSRTATLMNVD